MEVRPNETVDNSTQYRRHVPATPSKQPVVPPNTVETTSVSQRSRFLEFSVCFLRNLGEKKKKRKTRLLILIFFFWVSLN
jgi:hypothetical protein